MQMMESSLTKMKAEELRPLHARLKAGQVGQGFDKQYLPQVLGMVARELKFKEPKAEQNEKHRSPGRGDENRNSV